MSIELRIHKDAITCDFFTSMNNVDVSKPMLCPTSTSSTRITVKRRKATNVGLSAMIQYTTEENKMGVTMSTGVSICVVPSQIQLQKVDGQSRVNTLDRLAVSIAVPYVMALSEIT